MGVNPWNEDSMLSSALAGIQVLANGVYGLLNIINNSIE